MNRFIRTDDKAVSPVIAVILMVAITVVLAGVLWALISDIDPPTPRGTTITVMIVETNYGWRANIIGVVGGEPSFDDIKFQMINYQGTIEYKITIDDAKPSELIVGLSKVYPMTKGGPVQDNTTGSEVNSNSKVQDYEGCYIAYIDQDGDGRISVGDILHIYKDYDNDGIEDISSNSIFEITIGNDRALHKPL